MPWDRPSLHIPNLPALPAFGPLIAIKADIDRLGTREREVRSALGRIPVERTRAEQERLRALSEGLSAGKSATEADPGDAAIIKIDREKEALLRERDALRMAVAAKEHAFSEHRAAHAGELKAAVRAVIADVRVHAHASLDAARTDYAELDRLTRALGLAHGAKDPRGLPAYIDGKRLTAAAALDYLAGALGPDRPATDDAADEAPLAQVFEGIDTDEADAA